MPSADAGLARRIGSVRVIGLGPGRADQLTDEARAALERAEHVLGYHTYLARLPPLEGKVLHGSDNGDELERARHALELA
ncbi:MAG TPA: SAM-dependent methyltransferase, partial [Polyangiaceae bacterium]|nr:SAM-dependent methyltransferase [Polyangiaceae bacterium]